MKDLFISYSHEDSATARRLAALLEASGLTVWWDPQLRAGQDFAVEIERVLQQVRCVIVLWSSHSVDSRWVRAEANEGLRLGKLVPVALDDSTPPLVFRAIHTAPIATDRLEADAPGVQKLIDDLRAMLKQPTAAGGGATPAPAPYPWHYPALLAAAVGATLLALALAALPTHLLDRLTGSMAAAPLQLTPAVTESLLLAAALALLLAGGRRLHFDRFRNKRWTAVVMAAGLATAICVYTWGVRWIDPAPDHLTGKVVATEWNEMQIVALDALNQPISLGEVPVSTENGEFGMRLRRTFFDRPRTLRLSKPGCAVITSPIPWQAWNSRSSVTIAFRCGPVS